ncbi:hypothetical protein K2173_026116 [Erythroxylum novogranatense]|uniref:Uncharacterized protein n=1 Tax=Erythroxylum novogranatense TaxID=1862640 RepID=A0AAV8SI66_9ROSI|nr:hypothetical protein K2173_026116 [Erythroxylum novogranatense]
MEGVGARLGRSSTRYGPPTVFNGRVRKWKKRWVHVSASTNNNHTNHNHQNTIISNNGTSNGNNGSHLVLYKWTPLSQSNNNKDSSAPTNAISNSNANKNSLHAPPQMEEEPAAPKRKFKYIPVYLLEEQKKEAEETEEKGDDESNPSEVNTIIADSIPQNDGFDEKPDINDTPMEDQDDNGIVRQDLNESTLDLSLGLNSLDRDSDSRPDQPGDAHSDRVNSSTAGT